MSVDSFKTCHDFGFTRQPTRQPPTLPVINSTLITPRNEEAGNKHNDERGTMNDEPLRASISFSVAAFLLHRSSFRVHRFRSVVNASVLC
jgi:hypothetical protein